MKLQRYKPKHAKKSTFAIRMSSFVSVLERILKSELKKRSVQLVTMLLVISMTAVSVGEYVAPFEKTLKEKEATKLGMAEQVLEVAPTGGEEEQNIELSGWMPENSSAEVIDVTEAYKEAIKDANVLAAFDITIKDHGEEYQPNELYPISVEINNLCIEKSDTIQLWHFKDDGTREVIDDFSIENGILSFNAKGFSVYSIVEIAPQSQHETVYVTDLSEVIPAPGEDPQGFYLSYKESGGTRHYFTNMLHTSQKAIYENPDPKWGTNYDPALWYFEKVGNYYRIYTLKSGTPNYLTYAGSNGSTTGYVGLTTDSTSASILLLDISDASTANHTFRFKKSDEDFWLQHSGGGGGIRFWNDTNNAANSSIYIAYPDDLPDDELGLDGKTYGIMSYPGGTSGFGLTAASGSVDMVSLTVRKETGIDTLYVDEEDEIAMWTFHNVSGYNYKLSTEVGGATKWLKMGSSSLSVVDNEAEATEITLNADTKNRLQFSADGKAITFDNNAFSVVNAAGSDSKQRLHLVNTSSLTNDDYVTYYADKVSVSEVPNGSTVIVYTRVWNDYKKQYDFYAIDHDGTLYPCYERGDSIMWLGGQINTLSWDFTEYYNEDGTVNNYYELYNAYSKKYIAPQIEDNQVLSDEKIGISLTGRKNGEYYSDIVAWDEIYYAYSGLQSDVNDRKVLSGPKAEADTYYFAIIPDPASGLTEVETVDHERYGVTMKMVDFPNQGKSETAIGDSNNYNKSFNYQNYFLGVSTFIANSATTGILSNYLDDDGYPTVANTESEKYGESLSVLYNEGYSEFSRPAYPDYVPDNVTVNHIFLESTFNATGYFEFDNCQNFATLIKSDGTVGTDFTVYKELGSMDTTNPKNTWKHGQFMPYNTIRAGSFAQGNSQNLCDALGNELPETDPRKYEKLHVLQQAQPTNHYNGMEMSCSITQSANGKDAWGNDIIFEFTGDDDFWFYVDKELVLDLGGIHSALSGSVNFSTGTVVCNGVTKTLRQVYRENYISRNPDATSQEVNDYLAQFFEGDGTVFKAYTTHEMRVFYMERGAGASNLHMRFNLNSVTPGNVMLKKEVTGSDDADFDLVEYPYQIWYKLTADSEPVLLTKDDAHVGVVYQNSTQKVDYLDHYTPPNSNVTYDSVFLVNPDKVAEICFPEDPIMYKIIECGVNTEVYNEVDVNGMPVLGETIPGANRSTYDSDWDTVKSRPVVLFTNHVNPDALRTLTFEKRLYDENGTLINASTDQTVFNFRLFLSNGTDENLEPAYMVKYYVKDYNGYLCRWDHSAGRLVSTTYMDYDALPASEKSSCTFETSMNGAISKIPSGYSIGVPNIPVGTRFKMEEWDNEIPLGYSFLRYDRDEGTYIPSDGDTLNSGWVRPNESPKMFIDNERGWGINVNKEWSDSDFTSSHAPIYTAVYVDNVLVEGTVRQISGSKASMRYFFDELMTGKVFADYKVCEVVLTNPSVDSDGVVHYDSITRLNEGDLTAIDAVPKGSDTAQSFSYGVEYTQGDPSATAEGLSPNVRTDIVTNTRQGGVVITLYDMKTGDKLSGGTFTLMQGSEKIGDYTADSHGRITILYDFDRNVDYTLTETSHPTGYVGLENPTVFRIANDDTVTVSGNGAPWESSRQASSGENLIAYIDIFNKPFSLEVIKVRAGTDLPRANAHFALYCERNGIGGKVKDTNPMRGYEDLVTGADGVVPKVDNTLDPGRYYLDETIAPPGYELFDEEIVFVISERGEITVESAGHSGFMTVSGTNEDNYAMKIPNELISLEPPVLTINSHTTGTFGDKNKQFVYTFNVTGATLPEEGCEWYRNGVKQTTNLHNGDTFTLADGDTVSIGIDVTTATVTITEASVPYAVTSTLDEVDQTPGSTMSFELVSRADPYVLEVTNTLDAVVPTGIFGNSVLPFAVLMAVLCLGYVVVFVVRKRKK